MTRKHSLGELIYKGKRVLRETDNWLEQLPRLILALYLTLVVWCLTLILEPSGTIKETKKIIRGEIGTMDPDQPQLHRSKYGPSKHEKIGSVVFVVSVLLSVVVVASPLPNVVAGIIFFVGLAVGILTDDILLVFLFIPIALIALRLLHESRRVRDWLSRE